MRTRWLVALALVVVMLSSSLLYGADKGRSRRSAKNKDAEEETLSLGAEAADDSDADDEGASAKSKKSTRKASKRASSTKRSATSRKKAEDPESVYEDLKAKRDKLWKALDDDTQEELEAAIEKAPKKSASAFKSLCPKGMAAAKFQRCVTAGLEAEAARLKCESASEKAEESDADADEAAPAGKKTAKQGDKQDAKQGKSTAKKQQGDGEEFSDDDIDDADVPAEPARKKQPLVKRGEYDEETDEAISMGETYSDDDGSGWRDPGHGDDFSIDENGVDESTKESDFSTGQLGK